MGRSRFLQPGTKILARSMTQLRFPYSNKLHGRSTYSNVNMSQYWIFIKSFPVCYISIIQATVQLQSTHQELTTALQVYESYKWLHECGPTTSALGFLVAHYSSTDERVEQCCFNSLPELYCNVFNWVLAHKNGLFWKWQLYNPYHKSFTAVNIYSICITKNIQFFIQIFVFLFWKQTLRQLEFI